MAGPRKSRAPLIISLVLGIVAVLCGGSIVAVVLVGNAVEPEPFVVTDGSTGWTQMPAQNGLSATFEVTGPSTASITWGVGTQLSQNTEAKLPFSDKRIAEAFPSASVVAQNNDPGYTGEIKCKITLGDKVFQNVSSGAYAVVTCNAMR